MMEHRLSDKDFPLPFMFKEKGWLFLNGNVVHEGDLISMFREQIVNPQHSTRKVNDSRKVLLVTAAFDKGQEHADRHLIRSFESLNIDGGWQGNLPHNIQNLSVYTMFQQFQQKEPWLYRRYTEKQDQIIALKRDYHGKVFHYVQTIYELIGSLQENFKGLGLFDFYHSHSFRENPNFFLLNREGLDRENHQMQLDKLSKSLSGQKYCRELRLNLDHLIYLDNEILTLLMSIENYFLNSSGIAKSELYHRQRDELSKRILESASVFIFGGRVYVLVNRLRFYQLADVFQEAIDKGTNVYGISAGSICQTHRFTLSFDRSGKAGDVIAADFGLGLIKGMRVFPHANDIGYMEQADRNELTFFVLRHQEKFVIGLKEKSVLLREFYRDPIDHKVYKRFSSVGEDPIMVFGERGERVDLQKHDEILMEGSKFFSGIVQVATRMEINALERAWRINRNQQESLGTAEKQIMRN